MPTGAPPARSRDCDRTACRRREQRGSAAPVDAGAPYRRALDAERLRRTRQINAFRVQAVGIFLVVIFVFHSTVPGWVAPPFAVFLGYLLAAAGVWWLQRRSQRVARLTSLSIPLVDMPMVSVLIRQ